MAKPLTEPIALALRLLFLARREVAVGEALALLDDEGAAERTARTAQPRRRSGLPPPKAGASTVGPPCIEIAHARRLRPAEHDVAGPVADELRHLRALGDGAHEGARRAEDLGQRPVRLRERLEQSLDEVRVAAIAVVGDAARLCGEERERLGRRPSPSRRQRHHRETACRTRLAPPAAPWPPTVQRLPARGGATGRPSRRSPADCRGRHRSGRPCAPARLRAGRPSAA